MLYVDITFKDFLCGNVKVPVHAIEKEDMREMENVSRKAAAFDEDKQG